MSEKYGIFWYPSIKVRAIAVPAGQFSQDPHMEGRLNAFKTPSFLANFDLAIVH